MLLCPLILSVLCRYTFWPCARWRSFAILPLSERTSPTCRQKHPHPVNVVRQVAQADFHSGSGYADRTQQQITRSLGLCTKDVLDPRTDPGPGLIAFLFSWRQGTIAAPLALDVFAKTVLRIVDCRFLSLAFSRAGRNISQLTVSLILASGSPFLPILCNRSCRSKKPGWIMAGLHRVRLSGAP